MKKREKVLAAVVAVSLLGNAAQWLARPRSAGGLTTAMTIAISETFSDDDMRARVGCRIVDALKDPIAARRGETGDEEFRFVTDRCVRRMAAR